MNNDDRVAIDRKTGRPVSRGKNGNLRPFGTGAISEEEERALRVKGAQTLHRQKRARKDAIAILRDWATQEVSDAELQAIADKVNTSGGDTPLGIDAIYAGVILNVIRKGTICDLRDFLDLIGANNAKSADEDAQRALFAALTNPTSDRDGPAPNVPSK